MAPGAPSSTLFPYTTLFRSQRIPFGQKTRPGRCHEPEIIALCTLMINQAREVFCQRNDFWLMRSEEHTSELQSRLHLVCRLLLEKKKTHHTLEPRIPQTCSR